jgi:hypothetical protein
MRRIACTVSLSIFLFATALLSAGAASPPANFVSVDAAADSSGVSITISHSSVQREGDPQGSISITVSSASTEQTLICTLDPGSASIEVRRHGEIDVSWITSAGANITFVSPSIRVAGILSNFQCEEAG